MEDQEGSQATTMTEWWEFTRVVIIPLVFGAYAFAAGAYGMGWLVQREARKGRKELWEAHNSLKENELHDLDRRIMQLEGDTEKG